MSTQRLHVATGSRSPESLLRLVGWQVHNEQRIFWRQGFGTTATIFMPLLFLVLFATVYADAEVPGRSGVTFAAWLVPGVVAFGVAMATFPTMAVSTAVLRERGVLRRYHTTPLPGWVFMLGRIGSAVLLSVIAVALTLGTGAVAYDVAVRMGDVPLLVLGVLLGTACFTAFGLALARFVPRAEAVQAISVAVLIPLSMISGIFLPTASLPPWLDAVGQWLPLAPVGAVLQTALGPDRPPLPGLALPQLVVWTGTAMLLARGVFSGAMERG